MRLGSSISENAEGHYQLVIAQFFVLTTKTRQQAEGVRDYIMVNPKIYRMLGEYSAKDLMTRAGGRPIDVVSDEKARKLRFRWGREANDEWNFTIAPKLLERDKPKPKRKPKPKSKSTEPVRQLP